MVVSTQFVFYQHYIDNGVIRADIGRIASNVVVGIGFLGGGAILHSGLRIKGLTTAASLWLVAAVGLAAGAGMFVLAIAVTVITVFVLVALRIFEQGFKAVLDLRVRVDTEGEFLTRAQLQDALRPLGAVVTDVDYARDQAQNRSRIFVDVRLPSSNLEEPMVKILENLPAVQNLRVRRPAE
jgi:putative Mg2+ transporter-C (MgtC) family protein